jgi:hypothetical protein
LVLVALVGSQRGGRVLARFRTKRTTVLTSLTAFSWFLWIIYDNWRRGEIFTFHNLLILTTSVLVCWTVWAGVELRQSGIFQDGVRVARWSDVCAWRWHDDALIVEVERAGKMRTCVLPVGRGDRAAAESMLEQLTVRSRK